MMKTISAITLFLLIFMTALLSAQDVPDTMFIYSDAFASIHETRILTVVPGVCSLRLLNIPTTLIPSSLRAEFDGTVTSRSFRYTSPAQLLHEYVGEEIEVVAEDSLYRGILLDGGSPLKLRDDANNIHLLYDPERITLPGAGSLSLTPSIELTAETERKGQIPVDISYLATGIVWGMYYSVTLDADQTTLSIEGWAQIANECGQSFSDVIVHLVAGELNEPQEEGILLRKESLAAAGVVMQEQTAFEYHVYDVPGRVSVADDSNISVPFLSYSSIPAQKTFVYDGLSSDRVLVEIGFANDPDTGLGIPLPRGSIRVFQYYDDKRHMFVGENSIQHTPVGEEVSIQVGAAFDIVGERTQLSRKKISSSVYKESYLIELSNYKKDPVEITVVEHLPGASSEITSASEDFTQVDAKTIEFDIDIPAGRTANVTYTVEYAY